MRLRDKSGVALVVTLMVLALVTALVVEFASAVYVHTGRLGNWETSERLSATAASGASLAAWLVAGSVRKDYTHPGRVEIPPTDPYGVEDDAELLAVTVEDENAKFNLNTLVFANGELNAEAHASFERLLLAVDAETELASGVADWIDPDLLPRVPGGETGARNAPLRSVDELLLIPGVGRDEYDKVSPYVTVWGSGQVNINGAEEPVLMSLSEDITRELARRVTGYRDRTPFTSAGDLTKVAGFEQMGIGLMGRITVKGTAFRVSSRAASPDGIQRVVACVLDDSGRILYWREH
jgi:general secretion pathway protein K